MKRNQKGFTLVELIIVIAVIGVLAAILIPVFADVITKANRKSAYSDAKNALTSCLQEFVDEGITPTPDTLFFVHKGNNIYVYGYTEEFGNVRECVSSFNYDSLAEVRSLDVLDGKIEQIMATLTGAGHITTEGFALANMENVTRITSAYNTDNMRIVVGLRINAQFSASVGVGSGSTDTEPALGSNCNIVFAAGENSANGGGVKDDGSMPENQEVSVGAFAQIPDDKIPHSVTLVAAETNAYAFKSWQGSDGNTYYPGDAIKIQSAGTLTLTAQWENGYTVLAEDDDFTKPFDNLAGKYIMCNDVAVWYNNSEYMFPIGYDSDYMMWTGEFTGVLDGAGYKLSNLTCSYTSSNCPTGLVYSNKGTISNMNLTINGLYSKGKALAGVASYNYGTIRNVDVNFGNRSNYYYSSSYGDIACLNTQTSSTNAGKVGGVAAINSGLISGCRVDGIQLRNYVSYMGGIVGENKSGATVEKCYSGEVKTTIAYSYGGDSIGGVVGWNAGTVKECMSVGMLTNLGQYTTPVGGLVGKHTAGEIRDCYVDWSENTIACVNPTNGYYYAGVVVGDCTSASAKIVNCVGIGNDEKTNVAFCVSPLATTYYTAENVQNCYLVGSDTRTVVNIISVSDLASRSPLTGLTDSVWDFSSGAANIPGCN